MNSTPLPKIKSYRDLVVWQRGISLIAETYQLSARLPECEIRGLTPQMRRAAIAIAANIAEGHGRRSRKDYLKYLVIAAGSLRELETYLEVCRVLGYASAKEMELASRFANEIGAMLSSLCYKLGRGPSLPS